MQLGHSELAKRVAHCPPNRHKHRGGWKCCHYSLCPYCRFRKANAHAKLMYRRVYFAEQPVFITLKPDRCRTLDEVNKDLARCKVLKQLRNKIIYREYDHSHCIEGVHVHIIADAGAMDRKWLTARLDEQLPMMEYWIQVQAIQRTKKDVWNVLCYATKVPGTVYTDPAKLQTYMELTYRRKLITKTGQWAKRVPKCRLRPFKEQYRAYFDFTIDGKSIEVARQYQYHRVFRISTLTGEIRDITNSLHKQLE